MTAIPTPIDAADFDAAFAELVARFREAYPTITSVVTVRLAACGSTMTIKPLPKKPAPR